MSKVSSIGKKVGVLTKVEELLGKARTFAEQLQLLENPEWAKLVGFFDVRVVAWMLELPGTFEDRLWANLDEIEQDRLPICPSPAPIVC